MSKVIVPLTPCKHCGGEAEAQKYTGEIGFVRCTVCGIQTPFLQIDEAIRRWNMDARRTIGSEIS